MSELPNGWTLSNLGELVNYGASVKVEPSNITDDEWVLELEDIEKDSSRLVQRINFADRKSKSTKNRFRAGDVLYGKLRPNLNKVLLAGENGVCTTEVLPLRCPEGVLPQYLFYALKRSDFLDYVAQVCHGIDMPRLGTEAGRAAAIPVAPTGEQRRIVAKLERLRARSERARDELGHIPKLIERYKQAILAKAFSGELAAGCSTSTFEQIVAEGLVGLVRSAAQQHDEPGAPYIRMNHYDLWGRWNEEKLTRVHAEPNEMTRYELREGDVLFNTRNSYELVGKVAIWPANRPGHVYNNNLLRLRFKQGTVDPRFAAYYMISPIFREYLGTVKSATTSVCAIYQRSLMDATIPLPPIDRQRAVINMLDHAWLWLDKIANEHAHAARLLPKLDQAILAKAFRGELVPQDPNDEPASELLERIKAEREEPTKRRGRR
jgi:type I restriction enzyme S subunit